MFPLNMLYNNIGGIYRVPPFRHSYGTCSRGDAESLYASSIDDEILLESMERHDGDCWYKCSWWTLVIMIILVMIVVLYIIVKLYS